MIRRKKETGLVIDIDGPEGNAFVILAYAKKYADLMDMDLEPILEEMQSGDYINLLKVFMKNFPGVVLETSQEELLKEFEIEKE